MPKNSKNKIKDIQIINDLFTINDEVELDEEDIEYLVELEEELLDLIENEGEVGNTRIKEIVTDDLLNKECENLLKYLNLEIDENIKTTLSDKLEDENWLKIEEKEADKDFFNNYLKDDVINDLIMSLRGFDRKSDGQREIFIKRRSSKIPVERIIAIEVALKSLFNKTSFLSKKEDTEQAHLILLAFNQIFEILLEIPYDCCDTQKTIEILSMAVLKLSNLIGLSKGYREELMQTIQQSYDSSLMNRESESVMVND